MKILHTSDTHLGRELSNIDPMTMVSKRGLDYLESFKNVCKIALSEKVELFIIAGDMFDTPSPPQFYIIESMKMLKKVSKAGITTLIINGNTDSSTKNNPLAYLAEIDNVYVVTKPDTFIFGSYDIICVPYSVGSFSNILQDMLSLSSSDRKILVSHILLEEAKRGSEVFESIDSNYIVNLSIIPDKFVYVALGHAHKFQQVSNLPIFYSGSTERLDFSEENEDKYALVVEIDGSITVKPYRLLTRSMHTFNVDCSNLKYNELLKRIDEIIEANKEIILNSIVRLRLYNLDREEGKNIDLLDIKNRFSNSFECIVDVRFKDRKLDMDLEVEKELDNRLKCLSKDILERIDKFKKDIWRRTND